jgi:hypothetical protein
MSIVRTQQALFTPVRMGKLELWNRIVMAPPTRLRPTPGMRPPNFKPDTTRSAPRPVSSSANAPRLAARLTVGLILLVYGALRKFGDGAV